MKNGIESMRSHCFLMSNGILKEESASLKNLPVERGEVTPILDESETLTAVKLMSRIGSISLRCSLLIL